MRGLNEKGKVAALLAVYGCVFGLILFVSIRDFANAQTSTYKGAKTGATQFQPPQLPPDCYGASCTPVPIAVYIFPVQTCVASATPTCITVPTTITGSFSVSAGTIDVSKAYINANPGGTPTWVPYSHPTPDATKTSPSIIQSNGYTDVYLSWTINATPSNGVTVATGQFFDGCLKCRPPGSDGAVTIQTSPSGGSTFTEPGFPFTSLSAGTGFTHCFVAGAGSTVTGLAAQPMTCILTGKTTAK